MPISLHFCKSKKNCCQTQGLYVTTELSRSIEVSGPTQCVDGQYCIKIALRKYCFSCIYRVLCGTTLIQQLVEPPHCFFPGGGGQQKGGGAFTELWCGIIRRQHI